MIPILFATATEGTVPTSFGVGPLTDCLSCQAVEELNGGYELVMEYPINGIHASEIQNDRFIFAKPNFTDNAQLFRIYKVSDDIGGRFLVNAQHISYDLLGKIITSGTAASCAAACVLLTNNAGNFTINTDKTVLADFDITVPSSVRSWFGGKEGSIPDVYGAGEWHYDNYTASFLLHRGADRGVQIRYGKNLTELTRERTIQNLVTAVIPYAVNPDTGISVSGSSQSTGLVSDVPKDRAVDFSEGVNWEDSTPVITQLNALGAQYVSRYSSELINPDVSITLGFVQLSTLKDRVDLGDTVHIYFDALGISASMKCVDATWDVLLDRYTSCTFGSLRTSIADTISNQGKALSNAQNELSQRPTVSNVKNIVDNATALITGNLGGYVINGHDSNGDGYPDENLIMNTPDINTATNVIRMNLGGIGFSYGNGYAGPYATAINYQGIVADAITTGTLNANLIKAGVISDVQGNSEIDLANGEAKMYELKAIKGFTVLSQGDEKPRAQFTQDAYSTKLLMSHTDTSTPCIKLEDYSRAGTHYARLCLSDDGGDVDSVKMFADSIGGHLELTDENGNDAVKFFANSTYGGNWYLYNPNGANRFHAFVGSTNDDGILDLFDGNGAVTLSLVGKDGVIECGKVKPRDQIESLWTGSLTSGEIMVPYGPYSAYIVKWCTSTSGYYQTMVIPKIDLQDSIDQTYQFNTESVYYTFYMDYVGTTCYLKYRGRSSGSTSHICAVYGIY